MGWSRLVVSGAGAGDLVSRWQELRGRSECVNEDMQLRTAIQDLEREVAKLKKENRQSKKKAAGYRKKRNTANKTKVLDHYEQNKKKIGVAVYDHYLSHKDAQTNIIAANIDYKIPQKERINLHDFGSHDPCMMVDNEPDSEEPLKIHKTGDKIELQTLHSSRNQTMQKKSLPARFDNKGINTLASLLNDNMNSMQNVNVDYYLPGKKCIS